MIQRSHFPFDWTSTQLEGAIPNLCDTIGYDKPLSMSFANEGAPLFVFRKDEMSVKFDMLVEIFSEDYSQKHLDIHFKGLKIKFKMYLESNMSLFLDWEDIEMEKADIKPMVHLEDIKLDDAVVRDYFNFVFQELVPWVNEYHP